MEQQPHFYDIYDFLYVPFWKQTWFVITASIVGTILGALLIYLLIKWYRLRKRITSPWILALEALDKLNVDNVSSVDAFKKFYVDLTKILKWYMTYRFHFMFLDKTDEEMFILLKLSPEHAPDSSGIADIFTNASFIKFANYDELPKRAHDDLNAARSYIESTIPQKTKRVRPTQS